MALIDSSAVLITVGKIMAAKVNPPERMDHPILSRMTKKTNPKSPKIMEGTPARQSVPKRIIRLILLSRVYSLRKTAVPTPRGAPKKMATPVKTIVPIMVEKIPPSRPIFFGESRKKRRWRAGNPSFKIWRRIKIITAMVDRPAIQMRIFAMDCVQYRKRLMINGLSFVIEK
jgi:hypothetical protein